MQATPRRRMPISSGPKARWRRRDHAEAGTGAAEAGARAADAALAAAQAAPARRGCPGGAARAARDQAALNLSYTQIIAPAEGVVSRSPWSSVSWCSRASRS